MDFGDDYQFISTDQTPIYIPRDEKTYFLWNRGQRTVQPTLFPKINNLYYGTGDLSFSLPDVRKDATLHIVRLDPSIENRNYPKSPYLLTYRHENGRWIMNDEKSPVYVFNQVLLYISPVDRDKQNIRNILACMMGSANIEYGKMQFNDGESYNIISIEEINIPSEQGPQETYWILVIEMEPEQAEHIPPNVKICLEPSDADCGNMNKCFRYIFKQIDDDKPQEGHMMWDY